MDDTDLNGQFQQMCKQAEYSLEKIQDAISNRSQPQTDVATTKGRRSEADDRTRADTSHANASGHWQELRDHWHAHLAKVREDAEKKKGELDATYAAHYAEEAEGNAQEAIQFAVDAIGEAERTVLYAVSARAEANAPASDPASRA